MNKNIIIAILIVIIIAVVGIFVFHPGSGDGKLNTQINFLSESTLQNGDQIQIELKDVQGNALANQIVNFTYDANGHQEKYSVVTNDQGQAYLVLTNEDVGDHQVTVSFDGNDKYNPCSATQTITISEGEAQSTGSTDVNSTASTIAYDNSSSTSASSSNFTDSSSSSSSTEPLYYDSETGNHYNKEGIIVGGQNDGYSMDYIKNNPQQVDEDGNLV